MEINQQLEQWFNIKFLVKLGKNGPEIHQMLQQVYGEYALKERTVFKWVHCFREVREDPKDDARSGCPSTSSGNENIDHVRYLVLSYRRLAVRMIAEELGLGKSSIHTILTEHLEMKKICAKTVLKLLTPEQKLRRKECCVDWKTSEESDEFLERVITGDESWIYEYDIELKSQSRVETETFAETKKNHGEANQKSKSCCWFFFDCHGIVHHEFAPEGQTVNAAFYMEVLKRLRDRVRRVRPEFWEGRRWILHHDNAPAHSALIVCEFLAQNFITALEHPPYSPDLAPCDFFLFPKCKLVLRGWHLGDVMKIKSETTLMLKGLREEEFQGCFQQ